MKTFFSSIAILFIATVCAAEVTIPINTMVPVRATQGIDGKSYEAGQEITLVVAADIKISKEIVIKAGAPVLVFVEDVSNSQMAGIAGRVSLAMRSTVAVDGSIVPLNGSMINSGKSEVGSTVAVGAILCPLALLNKGETGRIAPGAEIRAMVVSEVYVDTDNPADIEYLSTEFVKDAPKKKERTSEF